MTAAEKIGCPDWLPIWNSSLEAAAIVFAAYFVMVNLLMLFEGHFSRGRYLTFLFGGIVCWPAVAVFAANSIEDSGPLSRPFTEPWFHVALLVLGVIVAIAMEIAPLRNGTFTWAQELSPSKIYHTIIFGPLLYVITISTIVVFSNAIEEPVRPFGILAAFALFALAAVNDRVVYWTRNHGDPHVEFNWRKWSSRTRFSEQNKHGPRGGGSH